MNLRAFLFLPLMVIAFASDADEYVNSYTRRDGTYVEGHMRSSPNGSAYDNYSTRGNTNPYTGERGSRDPNGYGSSYGNSSGTGSSYGGSSGYRGGYGYGR